MRYATMKEYIISVDVGVFDFFCNSRFKIRNGLGFVRFVKKAERKFLKILERVEF